MPTDGSVISELAIEEALKMAEKLNAEITVLHVVPSISPLVAAPYSVLPGKTYKSISSELEKSGLEIIDKVKDNYKDTKVVFNMKILNGDAAQTICNEAKEGRYDLIVMANRGLGEIKQFLMGSVSNKVVKHADCSVLIFK